MHMYHPITFSYFSFVLALFIVTQLPMAVNFLLYRPNNKMRVPIEFINADECLDIRRGAMLLPVNKFVEVQCLYGVPATIKVDLSNKKKGSVLRLADLQLPPFVRIHKSVSADYVLAVIQGTKG
jgi:large subunit ribosomal protein L25